MLVLRSLVYSFYFWFCRYLCFFLLLLICSSFLDFILQVFVTFCFFIYFLSLVLFLLAFRYLVLYFCWLLFFLFYFFAVVNWFCSLRLKYNKCLCLYRGLMLQYYDFYSCTKMRTQVSCSIFYQFLSWKASKVVFKLFNYVFFQIFHFREKKTFTVRYK